jgi:hypothetical protein
MQSGACYRQGGGGFRTGVAMIYFIWLWCILRYLTRRIFQFQKRVRVFHQPEEGKGWSEYLALDAVRM